MGRREARVSSRIENAGGARTFDAGIDEARGLPWIAMEFVAGETLFMEREAPLSRDLKPENVLVTDERRLKVGDFGVAKSMDAATFDSTQAGLGTPMWTAPEQGREGWVPSPRADVWALGLLVYRQAVLEAHRSALQPAGWRSCRRRPCAPGSKESRLCCPAASTLLLLAMLALAAIAAAALALLR